MKSKMLLKLIKEKETKILSFFIYIEITNNELQTRAFCPNE